MDQKGASSRTGQLGVILRRLVFSEMKIMLKNVWLTLISKAKKLRSENVCVEQIWDKVKVIVQICIKKAGHSVRECPTILVQMSQQKGPKKTCFLALVYDAHTF